jgi:phenylalanyl-tRNA synthetase beta chain
MKVSLSWLSDYTPIRLAPAELAEALTRVGLAVDAVVDRYRYLDTVRVGRVVAVDSHPAADKLTVCRVDTGEGLVDIVCGAPNVGPGVLAPVALPGTLLPGGTTVTVETIRGQRSEGMLCSDAELALGPSADGIRILDGDLAVGSPLNTALGLSDPVLDLDLTPNRADCLSIIGIAREVAAIQKTRLVLPAVPGFPEDAEERIQRITSVAIDAPDHCPRYVARVLDGITVGPSPAWLQERLLSVGLRPINNIVDVTNFVMMEWGQPLHAFDLDRLAGQRIVVRTAAAGDTFVTLDGRTRVLDPDMLMICDGEKPVAVAGVMGGLNSEIEAGTARVLIESAWFDPVSVRKTSKKLGLSTDASRRFERGVDPQGTARAATRAAALMAAMGAGGIVGGVIDAHPRPWSPRPIRLSVRRTRELLGVPVGKTNISRLLASIGFTTGTSPAREELVVTAPSFRVDVARPEDLIEEVARLSGFDAIPTTYPPIPAGERPPAPRLNLRRRLQGLLAGFGFAEIITYSFVHAQSADRLRLPAGDPRRRTVPLLNPLTEEQSVMRSSLIPGLLDTLRFNLFQQVKNVKVFEIGKVFIAADAAELPAEPEIIAGLWSGARAPLSWHGKEAACDFFDLKGALESLFSALKLEEVAFSRLPDDACCYTRPGASARIEAGNLPLGIIGEIDPEVAQAFDLKQTAFVFELDADSLQTALSETKYRMRIPRFPALFRDITLILAQEVAVREVLEAARAFQTDLLERIQLFDVFTGDPIPAGRKSLSFRLTYRSPEKTLEEEDVRDAHQRFTERMLAHFNAALPG